MALETDRTGTIFVISQDENGDHRTPYAPGSWTKPEGSGWLFTATDIASLPADVAAAATEAWTPAVISTFADATRPSE